jgi:hypothetical protein
MMAGAKGEPGVRAHHIDTDYYDRFFGPGACGPTHQTCLIAVLTHFERSPHRGQRRAAAAWAVATPARRRDPA